MCRSSEVAPSVTAVTLRDVEAAIVLMPMSATRYKLIDCLLGQLSDIEQALDERADKSVATALLEQQIRHGPKPTTDAHRPAPPHSPLVASAANHSDHSPIVFGYRVPAFFLVL
jgi:hypothetical protein